jgi:hypothetical protein
VLLTETVENLSACDRPIAWTQHVTLGAPFIEPGKTRFAASATRSRTFEGEFGNLFPRGVDFDWPHAPLLNGGIYDLRSYTDAAQSAGYTAHLMDPARERACFAAWSPSTNILFGYRWRQADFPWMGVWEENRVRQTPPWNGKTITRGMEFGVSPMPETRRAMIERGSLFGVPSYRWVPAHSSITVSYEAFIEMSRDGPTDLSC